MEQLKLIYFIALLIALQFPAIGQFSKFELKQISQEHGLPGVSGRHVFQDSKGLMWFGVESYGLAKYDGYSFEVFAHDKMDKYSISNNVIESICEDDESNIWAGTQNGISIFQRDSNRFRRIFKKENSPYHLPGNYINELIKAQNGDIWIATESGAAYYSKISKTFTHFLTNANTHYWVSDIEIDHAGTVWFATWRGLFFLHQGKIEQLELFYPKTDKAIVKVDELKAINDSLLFLTSNMDVFEYNINSQKLRKIKIIDKLDKGIHNSIIDMEVDHHGNLWIATTSYGISIYFPSTGAYQNFQPSKESPLGIKHYATRDVYVDRTGMVWLAVKFQGFHYFNYQNLQIKHIHNQDTGKYIMREDNIISLKTDRKNKIWVGISDGGVHFYDPETDQISPQTSLKYPHLNVNKVNAIEQDSSGKIWIGTPNNLYTSDENFVDQQWLKSADVIDIACDRDNLIWIGTRNGLMVAQDGKLMSFKEYYGAETDLDHFYIKTIYVDSKNRLWIGGTTSGLFLFEKDSKKLTHFIYDENNQKSISGNLVRGIIEDDYGTIWIATKSEGLNRFNWEDSTFTNFREKDGLPINTLFGIEKDTLDNLWISSFQGICKFNVKTYETENYTREYGLQNDIFEPNATTVDSSGLMYFGGDNGFNQIDPYNLKLQFKSVPLVFTSIKVFDNQIYTDVDSSITIELNYDENNISFAFALLDYTSSLGIQYQYMLEGYEKKWNYSKHHHIASYTNLAPGSYTFHAKGQTKDGFMNSNDIRIYLIIDAPLWKKTWFRITVLLLFILLVFSAIILRLRDVRRQNVRLEYQVKEQTDHLLQKQEELIAQKHELENANATKNTLVSVIAHDLKNQFNPIVSLSSLLMMRSRYTDDPKMVKHSRMIYNSSNAVLSVLENMLYWYKNQSSVLVPELKAVNIYTVLEEIRSLYTLATEQKNITVSIPSSLESELLISADIEMLNTIIRNLLNNAIKFTDEGGEIKLEIVKSGGYAEIMIIDNGRGMKQEQLENLFNFKSRKHKKADGSGLGLQICKQFTDAMKGKLKATSQPGSGCCFTLILPLWKASVS